MARIFALVRPEPSLAKREPVRASKPSRLHSHWLESLSRRLPHPAENSCLFCSLSLLDLLYRRVHASPVLDGACGDYPLAADVSQVHAKRVSTAVFSRDGPRFPPRASVSGGETGPIGVGAPWPPVSCLSWRSSGPPRGVRALLGSRARAARLARPDTGKRADPNGTCARRSEFGTVRVRADGTLRWGRAPCASARVGGVSPPTRRRPPPRSAPVARFMRRARRVRTRLSDPSAPVRGRPPAVPDGSGEWSGPLQGRGPVVHQIAEVGPARLRVSGDGLWLEGAASVSRNGVGAAAAASRRVGGAGRVSERRTSAGSGGVGAGGEEAAYLSVEVLSLGGIHRDVAGSPASRTARWRSGARRTAALAYLVAGSTHFQVVAA